MGQLSPSLKYKSFLGGRVKGCLNSVGKTNLEEAKPTFNGAGTEET